MSTSLWVLDVVTDSRVNRREASTKGFYKNTTVRAISCYESKHKTLHTQKHTLESHYSPVNVYKSSSYLTIQTLNVSSAVNLPPHDSQRSKSISCMRKHLLRWPHTLTVYGGVGREILETTLSRCPLSRWLTCEICVCTTTAFFSCSMWLRGKGRGNGMRDSTSYISWSWLSSQLSRRIWEFQYVR